MTLSHKPKRIGGEEPHSYFRKPRPKTKPKSTSRQAVGKSSRVSSRSQAGEANVRDGRGEMLPSGMKLVRTVVDADGGRPAYELDVPALHGARKRIEVPYELANKPGKLIDHLITLGVKVDQESAAAVAKYLAAQPERAVCFRTIHEGWQRIGGDEAYVYGDEAFRSSGASLAVTHLAQFPRRAKKGSRKQWESIVHMCKGNPLLLASLCAGFASALLHPLNHAPFGVSIVGRSSTGKTTALRLVKALFDAPVSMATWAGTESGVEALAATHAHLPLVLDEIGQAAPRVLSDAAYRLMNGTGKLRAHSDGTLAAGNFMTSVVITSGEESIVERIGQARHPTKLGQFARFITLAADYEHGAFANLHGRPNGASFAKSLNDSAYETHGVAWGDFVSYLCRHLSKIKAVHIANDRKVKASLVEGTNIDMSDGICARVVGNFSLLYRAGSVAHQAGVFPVDEAEIRSALCQLLNTWHLNYQQHLRSPREAILDDVRSFVQKHRHDFPDWSSYTDPNQKTAIGFTYPQRDGSKSYAIFKWAFEELEKKHGRAALHDALIDKGWLAPGSDNRPTQQLRLLRGAGRVSMYVIRKSAVMDQ
ncbi:hypothetical protein PPN31114_03978 [Pandoraea pneumonica]|uniref:DUF927 domain-containing protein n=1 Tax=Pandoraea pneumonica TaxID=2508299 RepID=A0A5E4XM85_9BURK|nr:DUF927 domain-containing protein [Pandoraea pneumonica]VVE37404.1 hypothetical protein PPN31114_03978 [Pandoraea pneumonica]